MTIVLVDPPAIADAQQSVAGQVADQVIERVAFEHLLMAGVVELEAKLGGDQSECDRVKRKQPGIANNDQQKEEDDKHSEVGRDEKGVVPGCLPEEAGV